MSFKPLNRALNALQGQAQWQDHHQFQRLLQSWPEIVGPLVEAQTRPIVITKQNVLKVATSSSVWAQNLAFERHRILLKLNARLQKPLIDIRFSPTQWHSALNRQTFGFQQLWQDHPSQLLAGDEQDIQSEITSTAGQNSAFIRWANRVQARSRRLPLCSACQCPTPPGELKRWAVCALCAAKNW